jgi:hypothetical protein
MQVIFEAESPALLYKAIAAEIILAMRPVAV